MFLEDYGLWFEAYAIKRDKHGRVRMGQAWKHPVIDHNRFVAPVDQIIKTDDLEELESKTIQPGWGYLSISNNGIGLSILVREVKNLCHAEVIYLLDSCILNYQKIAEELKEVVIEKFGHPRVDSLSANEETQLRDLYYKKFGIELPTDL